MWNRWFATGNYLRRWDRRRISRSRTYDGMMVVEMVVPVEEGEEFFATLAAGMAQPVEKDGPAGPQLSTGQAHLDTPTDSSGADRYTVHVVADLDPCGLQRRKGRVAGR